MSNQEQQTKLDGGASVSAAMLGARDAFVSAIKAENFYREPGCKWSLKAHWTGAHSGFADEMLQRRWKDFEAGWKARGGAPNKEVTGA